jgi:hypothetical protein
MVEMVDVGDAAGTFTVEMPATFQINSLPVTIGGADLRHISGATDITAYLAGDITVLGATVLAGPSAEVGAPDDLLMRFDPGTACTPTDVELGVPTAAGLAQVLSYDNCGAAQPAGSEYSTVLLAIDVTPLQQVVFVGVQAAGPSSGFAHDLAVGIVESFRPV